MLITKKRAQTGKLSKMQPQPDIKWSSSGDQQISKSKTVAWFGLQATLFHQVEWTKSKLRKKLWTGWTIDSANYQHQMTRTVVMKLIFSKVYQLIVLPEMARGCYVIHQIWWFLMGWPLPLVCLCEMGYDWKYRNELFRSLQQWFSIRSQKPCE